VDGKEVEPVDCKRPGLIEAAARDFASHVHTGGSDAENSLHVEALYGKRDAHNQACWQGWRYRNRDEIHDE
jgi:hypothetical protein